MLRVARVDFDMKKVSGFCVTYDTPALIAAIGAGLDGSSASFRFAYIFDSRCARVQRSVQCNNSKSVT